MRPTFQFLFKKICILWLLLLLLPLRADSRMPARAGEKIRIQLKWFHQFQFAGYYAALNRGFYDAAGLDVEILEGGPSVDVLDAVTHGSADFGVLGAELAFHFSKGREIVALAPIIQHSIRAIIARKGIASPHDLAGKTMMLNTSELPEFEAMFLNEGMSMEQMNVRPKDRGANEQFIRGKIDAINGSIANQPFLFERENVPYTLIRPINYGIDFYGDTLFTPKRMIREHPEEVAAFLSATLKGWQYAFDHPEEIVDLILTAYASKKSRAHLMFEYDRIRALCHPDLVEIGHNNPQRWAHILDTYKRLGLVDGDARLDGFLYRDYLETERLWIKGILWGLAGAAAVLVFIALWNIRLRKAVRKMTRQILESRERLRITLDAIGDAVIATDGAGRIVRMNPVAETLTGWPLDEARGVALDRVFKIINIKTGAPVKSPVQKVLEEGRVVGLDHHTALVSRDGTTVQIADSGAPIHDQNKNIVGVVLVFRDMTEEYLAQERIRENERKFRSYMQNAPYGIFILNPSGKIIEVNHTMGILFARSAESLLDRAWTDMVSVEQGGRDEGDGPSLIEALETGRSHGIASFYPSKGREKVCEVDLVRLGPERVLGFVNDITHRRVIEARALNLSKFPSENPNPVLRVDPEGLVIYANRGSRSLLATWQTAIGEKVPPVWGQRIAKALSDQRPTPFEEQVGPAFFSLVITPVPAHGYVNIYGMDVTGLHKTRDLLKKSEAKYRDLVEGTDDLILSIDPNGQMRFANRKVESYTGISQENASGQSFFSFVHPEDRAAVKRWFYDCSQKQISSASCENRLVNDRTGEVRHMLWTCKFNYAGKGVLKSVNCVARDVTDRKRLEEEKQAAEESLRQASKMEAVGNIAGGIAHDFNNIMGIIIGNVELAMEELPEWNRAKRNLEEIKIAGLRASEVVKQLLSFSRKSDQHKKIIHLQPIVEESVSLLRASIPTSIELRVDMQEQAGPIEADPIQIHQILINLCTNAAHAMDENGGVLGIGLRERVLDADAAEQFINIAPGRYVELVISDTGQGIDSAILSKIFDPYFTTKKVGRGTGMGLAVVHGIVKSTGGGIRVDSRPGEGSTFYLVFPRARSGAVVSEPQEEPLAPMGSGRILLVDDESALLHLGQKQLKNLGYEVDIRNDPMDALAAVSESPQDFDLMITDMTMPGMTGDVLVEKVLEIRPDLPVILCTGYSSKIDRKRSRDIGVSGYIEKPFNRNQLARAVEKALAR